MKLATGNIKNWIYITGLPRSGTTFVGSVLSLPLEVDYIHEPFNPHCGLPGIEKSYRYIRPTLDTRLMQEYDALTAPIFTYDFTLKSHNPVGDPLRRRLLKKIFGSRGPFYLRLAKINPFHKTAIIKDPTSPLVTEYLYKNFNVKPLIIIKHPTSFVASIKRLGWDPNVMKLNDQPELIEDFFSGMPKLFDHVDDDPITSLAIFWKVIYKVLLEQASKYPSWQILTHEELSSNPCQVFNELYQKFELPWSNRIETKILKMTGNNNSTEVRDGVVQDFNRNSAEIFNLRRSSLSLEERKKIFSIVEDVALKIYSYESFAIN
jgi:hypothetical protein